MTIDAYLAELERALPRTGRTLALRETREHLRQAAERYRAGGASELEAETAATRDFGPVDEVARRLSAELVGPRKPRIVSAFVLGVAVVAPLLLAAGGIFLDRDEDGNAPTVVLVSTQPILPGTPGSTLAAQGMYAATNLPKAEVVEGAISDPSFLEGREVVVGVLPGEQLTEADFSP